MAYIESHQELGRHPKTRKAARLLGVSIPALIGHLHLLWHWSLDFAQDGDLSRHDPADIADAVYWEGDPEVFLAALRDCGIGGGSGFLDADENGALLLHDWYEYAGRLIERRQANAERMKNSRAKSSTEVSPESQDTCAERAQNVQDTYPARAGANVDDQTVSNRNVQKQTDDRPRGSSGQGSSSVSKNGQESREVETDADVVVRLLAENPGWDAVLTILRRTTKIRRGETEWRRGVLENWQKGDGTPTPERIAECQRILAIERGEKPPETPSASASTSPYPPARKLDYPKIDPEKAEQNLRLLRENSARLAAKMTGRDSISAGKEVVS